TRSYGDWSSDVCSSDLAVEDPVAVRVLHRVGHGGHQRGGLNGCHGAGLLLEPAGQGGPGAVGAGDVADGADRARLVDRHHPGVVDRKSTRLNSSHRTIS